MAITTKNYYYTNCTLIKRDINIFNKLKLNNNVLFCWLALTKTKQIFKKNSLRNSPCSQKPRCHSFVAWHFLYLFLNRLI